MAYGLTDDGFIIKRLDDIKTEIEDDFKGAFGDSVNLQAQGPFGQIIGIMSEKLSQLWELAEDVYNALDPNSATGISLDRVSALVNIQRLAATKSTVTVTCTGTPSTVIPAGTVFSVSGDPTARFVTDAEATIDGGGTVDVECSGETAGAVGAPASSLTVIETPVAGLTSITNALDANIGTDLETDAELRLRRRLELQQSLGGTLEGMRVSLEDIDAVDQVASFENTDDVIDGEGRPAHSFEHVVQNGDDQDIADKIWETKPPGIPSFGTELVTVVDSMGQNRDVYFSRPSEIPIYVIVNITRESGTSLPTETQVKEKVLDYGDGQNMGNDVLPQAGILPKIMELSNIRNLEVLAGTSNPPTLSDPITIDPSELSTFDTANITVNFI